MQKTLFFSFFCLTQEYQIPNVISTRERCSEISRRRRSAPMWLSPPLGGEPRQAWILLPLSQDGLQKSSGLFRLNLMQYWWRLVRLAQTTLRVDGSMPHQGNRGSLAGRGGEAQLSWRLIYFVCFSKWTDSRHCGLQCEAPADRGRAGGEDKNSLCDKKKKAEQIELPPQVGLFEVDNCFAAF